MAKRDVATIIESFRLSFTDVESSTHLFIRQDSSRTSQPEPISKAEQIRVELPASMEFKDPNDRL